MSSRECIKVNFLRKKNVQNLLEWLEDDNNIYIGRNMVFYVPGAIKSKWCNPYKVKEHGRENCLKLYEEHIKQNLFEDLEELDGKNLGCFCKPDEKCHSDILIKLLKQKKNI